MNARTSPAPRRARSPAAERPASGAPRRLAREVRELRRARGMTQRQLSARSGLQQAEISRIEAGRSNPTLSTIALLAAALGAELSLSPSAREGAGVRGRSSARRARFLCLVCAERLLEGMTPREATRHLGQYRVVTGQLRRRGQLLASSRLLPADTAQTVRVRNGKVAVTDGPFAETKELVGGYFVIEARDRAEAVRIAARLPGARIGCVEVRPIAEDRGTLRALGQDAASRAG